jgi:hypothetical protein
MTLVKAGPRYGGHSMLCPYGIDFGGARSEVNGTSRATRQSFFYGSDKTFFSGKTILDLTVGIRPRYPSAWMFRPKTIQRCKSGIFDLKEIHA